jgi:hypothetical protein
LVHHGTVPSVLTSELHDGPAAVKKTVKKVGNSRKRVEKRLER